MTRDGVPSADCDSWPAIEAIDATSPVNVRPPQGWYASGKVFADYFLAMLLLIPVIPLIIFGWLLVKATSRGPGLYTQTRLGRNGRPYQIFKLRSMTVHAEAGGVQWAKQVDCRVTPVGRLLRVTHLDELPQLFNVLMGDMSLVGPRPERPEMIRKKGLNEFVPGYSQRLLVKPGVTGLAQLQVPADSDIRSVKHKVAYDLYYIQHAGLWFDIRLLTATLLKAAGVSAVWLRRLFFLPSREDVEVTFCGNVIPHQSPSKKYRLQPA
jgi:lipopolysaccharide/colanic/teichoic acid biosynthesis glycosyltransferase